MGENWVTELHDAARMARNVQSKLAYLADGLQQFGGTSPAVVRSLLDCAAACAEIDQAISAGIRQKLAEDMDHSNAMTASMLQAILGGVISAPKNS